MCCSLWFLSLCLVLRVFSTVLQFPTTWKAEGLCCVLWFPFFVLVLEYFQQSYPLPMKAGIEWCAALLWFLSLCLVLRVFSTVLQFLPMTVEWCAALWFLSLRLSLRFNPTISPESRDWVMCCSFVIPFFVFGQSIFNSSILWKQGLSDVLLFCDSFFVFWSQHFPAISMKAGIGDVLLLWFLSLRLS
jgi:hypothetical protein